MAARRWPRAGRCTATPRSSASGAGNEPTLFWLTNHVRRVFATDLYLADGLGGVGEHAHAASIPGHWPSPWEPRRLVVQHMDAPRPAPSRRFVRRRVLVELDRALRRPRGRHAGRPARRSGCCARAVCSRCRPSCAWRPAPAPGTLLFDERRPARPDRRRPRLGARGRAGPRGLAGDPRRRGPLRRGRGRRPWAPDDSGAATPCRPCCGTRTTCGPASTSRCARAGDRGLLQSARGFFGSGPLQRRLGRARRRLPRPVLTDRLPGAPDRATARRGRDQVDSLTPFAGAAPIHEARELQSHGTRPSTLPAAPGPRRVARRHAAAASAASAATPITRRIRQPARHRRARRRIALDALEQADPPVVRRRDRLTGPALGPRSRSIAACCRTRSRPARSSSPADVLPPLAVAAGRCGRSNRALRRWSGSRRAPQGWSGPDPDTCGHPPRRGRPVPSGPSRSELRSAAEP